MANGKLVSAPPDVVEMKPNLFSLGVKRDGFVLPSKFTRLICSMGDGMDASNDGQKHMDSRGALERENGA